MRALVILLLISCPRSASAQDEELDDSAAFLAGADDTIVFDDGHRREPWQRFAQREVYRPYGLVHLGAESRVLARFGDGAVPETPFMELGVVLDVRFRPVQPWGMRFVAAVGYQGYERQNLGAGARTASGPFYVLFRWLPFVCDLGDWITMRAGPEISLHWIELLGGQLQAGGGASSEVVVRLFDGLVEIGAVWGAVFTPVMDVRREVGITSISVFQATLGGTLGVLLP